MCTRLEKESDNSNEATRVSVSLLYRMIEELESKMAESSEKKDAESETVSKDKIEIWEEREERFIRSIESVDDTDQNVDSQPENDNESVAFPFVTSSTHLPRNASLEEVAIEEIASSPDEEDCSPDSTRNNKTKKKLHNGAQSGDQKKGILSRTRKLFRSMFGRRKK
ncbi:hypothetical protein WN48_09761 [Eufriesea mexicana]|uniref:Uncharacterized protein n=2 Tax=Eufriesea mexicana TaxID=516756 RepID=A0A310SSQ3_9HYME|nr:hypothetical protein WN48_09761 [Eufriesea mexicana]